MQVELLQRPPNEEAEQVCLQVLEAHPLAFVLPSGTHGSPINVAHGPKVASAGKPLSVPFADTDDTDINFKIAKKRRRNATNSDLNATAASSEASTANTRR